MMGFSMRRFLCLLLGSAAVVGFETTFGFAAPVWQPEFKLPRMVSTGNDTLDDLLMARPGGIIRVTANRMPIQLHGGRYLVSIG